MVAVLSTARKALRLIVTLAAVTWLAACDVGGFGGGPLINTRAAVPVGLLVPASMANGGDGLARGLENAARLAIADLDGVEINLRVYDTGGRPEGAADAAQRAIADGARILIGPVFAESANAAGTVAAGRGVNVLAFSNNPTVAGGNVFVMGNTFRNTANRLVRYATLQGRSQMVIAHGQSTAEELGRDAIVRALAANGASPAGLASFELTQQGVINAIPGIADTIRDNAATAIFMTSGTDGALPFLADLLPENGVNPADVQFIGLQRLDVPASALTLGGLQGAWFATPDPTLAQAFRSRYGAAFGEPPHPLSALAYDGIAAVGALVATGEADALTVPQLTRPEGFAGVGGAFRLLPNGTNERGLAVAQIQNSQVVILDPAPRRFGDAGF